MSLKQESHPAKASRMCTSYPPPHANRGPAVLDPLAVGRDAFETEPSEVLACVHVVSLHMDRHPVARIAFAPRPRSEGRRVGTGCVSKGRSRWMPTPKKKNKTT